MKSSTCRQQLVFIALIVLLQLLTADCIAVFAAPAACEVTSFAVQAALSLFCELSFHAPRVHAGSLWLLCHVQGH